MNYLASIFSINNKSIRNTSMLIGTLPPKRSLVFAIVALYACATLQFIRFYAVSTTFYLSLPAYLSGHERLPFQERVLPILLMKGLYRLLAAAHATPHSQGAYTLDRAAFYIISLVSIAVAGYFTQQLYERVSPRSSLKFFVYPVFLFSMMWTYSIHMEANYSYPYDMLSVAFFSAGLYFIYSRKFLPLVAVILIGTFNRETTLFLIGIYLLDSASVEFPDSVSSIRDRLSLSQVRWSRVVLLLSIWVAIKILLGHVFAHNSQSENYVRILENVGRLKPRLWPALLNICGYVLPVVVLLRQSISSVRFRNYLLILPLWFAVMFYTGVILETRIYGELCPYASVALILIIESQLDTLYADRTGQEGAPYGFAHENDAVLLAVSETHERLSV
jgi:hypothetical protein